MRVRLLQSIRDPQPLVREASVVVIEDDFGNPLIVGSDFTLPGSYQIADVRDENFNDILRALGIDKVVIAEHLEDKLLATEELPEIGTHG